MKSKCLKRGIALLAASLFAPLFAQTGAGIVHGTVLDQSQAAVTGAVLKLTNADTNIVHSATTSTGGDYYFGSVLPGRYVLEVEGAGFKKWSGALVVEVGRTIRIDPALQVGSVDSVVSVQDVAPVISTSSAEVADIKDAQRIRQLPLNGRAISSLFDLTPGVEGGPAPRVNGLKVGSAEITLDGVTIADRYTGGIARVQPGLDTVQEFRIETSGSSARYARPATVTLVTKSGTNQLHGSAFETFRNNAFGLRARQKQDGNDPAKLIRNEFGISAGGPVALGKLYNGHNRTFWFFAYEGLRQRQANFQQDWVPTAAMWDGDFSNIVNNNGVQTHIYDPATTNAGGVRQPFPGDRIPKNRMNPIFDVMRSITSPPTNANNPFQEINLERRYGDVLDTNTYTGRLDHRFSDKDNIYGRITRSSQNAATKGGVYGSPTDIPDAFGSSRTNARLYSVSLAHNHLFSPTFVNELLLGVMRSPFSRGTLADFTDWAGKLGLPNPFGVTGFPTIDAGSDPFGWDSDNRNDQNLTSYSIEDNVTKVHGRHTINFGVQFRKDFSNVRELQQAQGSHSFGEDWTALYNPAADDFTPFTGSGLASMALGLPTRLRNQYNRGYFYFRQAETGLYVNDSWKVSSRLTLQLGLRWQKWTPYTEKYNRLVNVDPLTLATKFQVITPKDATMESLPGIPPSVLSSWATTGLTWTTANQANFPENLVKEPNTNFGPRLGAAYMINSKTVIRGAYGQYFWTMPLSQLLASSRTNPPLNLRYVNAIGALDGTGTFGVRTLPRPDFYVGTATVNINGLVSIAPGAQQMLMMDGRNWKDGRSHSFNFTIEREILPATALRISYIGNLGRNLEQRFNLNSREAEYNYQARTGVVRPSQLDLLRVNPNWNLSAINRTGFSNTHSAQAEVERRYSNGLALQFFYTFTRSLSTTDASGSSSGGGNINATDGTPGVPESINILGSPNLTYEQRQRLVYYNSSAIPAHRIRWNGIYDLPFGRGKRFGGNVSRAMNHLVGGWQIAMIGNWGSGLWLSVDPSGYLFGDPTLTSDQRLEFTYNGRRQRLWWRGDFDPIRATGVSQEALQALVPANRAQRIYRPLGANFDNRLPQQLADGTIRQTPITDTVNWNAKGFFRGPGSWNVDSSLFKNFYFTESINMRLTADFFNTFNHPLDNTPNALTGLQDLSTQPNQPRIVQFSLRLNF